VSGGLQFLKCLLHKYNTIQQTHGTYMKSLRYRTSDDPVQLLVCHPIIQGIHLQRHEQSRTHLSVCQGTACHIILIYQIVLCACV
jgi:hypothetical protein